MSLFPSDTVQKAPTAAARMERQRSPVAVAVAAIVAVAWYALVEWAYFSSQGPRFRRAFARANRVAVRDFSYRAPWLGAASYVTLVAAFALLAVWPAAASRRPPQQASRRMPSCPPSTCRAVRPGEAYLACLWRAVLLAAAVYVVYDLTTYATVFPFDLHTALWDMLYGAMVVPVLTVAPAAALLAHVMNT